ncbi:MAG: glycerol-3-phosphate dehydrogenase/oxidase [Deltaproteobacteria bacterium]|nr:glycerol-3-phosphate dehydrogenase/oxidase [Deltaproteobacteria bacterium]
MARPPELSARTRAKNLDVLSREPFDLLVIGGGITGAGIAREAVLRGLQVALVERRDFACGTSSRSSKLIHGGLRYLAQGDVALVMEAANERRSLRRIAPHLARPIHMLVPVHGRSGYVTISAGLFTYDRMARVLKEERNRMLGRDETLSLEPTLRSDRIYGAGLYYECLTDDARLVIENIKAAAALGAVVANYAAVTSLLEEGGKLVGATIRDEIGGGDLAVRAKVVVNAAGPWVDDLRLMEGEGEKRRLHLTKGIHLTLPFDRLPVGRCVVMNAADKRSVFAIPRGKVVYLGTTDTDYEGRYDDPPITADDAQYLLDAANSTFDVERLGFDDVIGAWAGLRPLLHQEGKKPSEISRKDEVMVGPTGLISMAGGKLTTYRKMAERVVGMVTERLQALGETLPEKRGDSETTPLSGGETGDDVDAFIQRLKVRWPRVSADLVERMIQVYGSNGERMVEAMANDPQLARRCGADSALTVSEVAYAVREEMAMTLNDFLERRSRLFLWDPNNGLNVAADVARRMGNLLGWDASRVDAEVEAYRKHVHDVKSFATSSIPEARVAHG